MEVCMLQKLLGSQARAEILKNLFTQEHKSIHLRELSRLSGLSAPVLQRELRQLEALGIVTIQKDGNRVKFSTANGTAHAGSDIDLFVIGDCGLRDVTKRIHAAAGKIGQEINPYVISQNDFTERLHKQDHFLNEIISTPKIFLKGDADEFARLAE